ncbi:MAG: ATP-binding cassette domain-containing protein [ANME-2 cluster archaeon]|nr:ATP-binding cassette domain-containing protein [ANME-2 cluster archaeon]MBC2707683.1 ATP-binding cassette domain-containing protein [ANME-2 cluster archaeon]
MFQISSQKKQTIRNLHTGMVYQNPQLGLKFDITSGGNIAEKLLAANWRSVGRIRERAGELLERTEIPLTRMDDMPRNFSGGMQQRVQIAKALANDPDVLLLDELTTGLDVSVQARILDLIKDIRRNTEAAMVLITHDLGVIRLLAERTIVLKNGRIVEAGLTDQILEDPQHEYTQLLVNSVL